MLPKDNGQLYQNSLKRNITRHYFLRNQRARSEMNMQELTVESADWLAVNQAHRFILNGWNSTKRISHLIIRGERKIGSFQNWRMEIEELKKFSCTETKRAQQLRIDELSWQEKESRSTVNQLTVQIQELQDKTNPLNDSSALGYPTFPVILQLLRVLAEYLAAILACSLTHRTCGTSGTVFEDPPAPNEPTAACCGNARSLTATHCQPMSRNTGRSVTKVHELERNSQNFTVHTPRFAGKFSIWNPSSQAEGAYAQICIFDQSRNQVSEMRFVFSPSPSTFQCWKTSFKTEVCSSGKIRFKTEVCTCSQFPTEAMLWIKEVEMVESVDDPTTSQSIGVRQFLKFEMLDAKIASALKKIVMNSYIKKKVNLEEHRPKWKTDFSVEGRLRSWSTNTSG